MNGSLSSTSSLARADPMARASVADSPESKVSPMPVKAVVNFAADEATRMSQASASDRPAPAAVPLTAATTGFAAPVSASTSGL